MLASTFLAALKDEEGRVEERDTNRRTDQDELLKVRVVDKGKKPRVDSRAMINMGYAFTSTNTPVRSHTINQ